MAVGNSIAIVPAGWRDLNALRRLEQVCFPKDGWPLFDVIGVLTFPNIVRLKAVIGEQMVGFIAGDVRTSQGMAWIATVGVLPEYRGRGIGKALMLACEERLSVPTIRLSVRISNRTAIELYERLGYRRVEEWARYYQDGEGALVMEKQRLLIKN